MTAGLEPLLSAADSGNHLTELEIRSMNRDLAALRRRRSWRWPATAS